MEGSCDEEESLKLALQLQAEEDEQHVDDSDGDAADDNDPELEATLALAMQLQQQDDAAQLHAALMGNLADGGVNAGVNLRALSPSQLDYEQLIRLGENVGHVSRGASQESVDELPVRSHAECCAPHSDVLVGAECAICRMPYEPDDELRILRCRHAEHKDCLDEWLKRSKACPLCAKEVVCTGETPL
ncbi:hypothetical protein KFE25_006717 [Diacronema lutheri]|uniref:RING-type domain-containing protein n=2 Tax=Diacronema lutheri TaxID=2081491 RepID=A0A8J5XY88_DIALT|nr:hypothetical protein KFE25_006717 [Diacronema lutheri]